MKLFKTLILSLVIALSIATSSIFCQDNIKLVPSGDVVGLNISLKYPYVYQRLTEDAKTLEYGDNILSVKYKLKKAKSIEKINETINDSKIETETIKLSYVPGVKGDFKDRQNIINQLEAGIEREMEYGMTLTGPHRDDFDIFMNETNIKKYGSQGQQRSCVLKMKLSECKIIKEKEVA